MSRKGFFKKIGPTPIFGASGRADRLDERQGRRPDGQDAASAAAGGGFAFALAADIRLAGESARMNAAFIKLGLSSCDMGVSYFLPRLVGVSVASELMLTGRFIHAPRALATGLVSEVVPDDALEAAARPYVDEMLAPSPMGLRMTKEGLGLAVDAPSLEAAMAIENRNQLMTSKSPNFAEGMAAFLEKRAPRYVAE